MTSDIGSCHVYLLLLFYLLLLLIKVICFLHLYTDVESTEICRSFFFFFFDRRLTRWRQSWGLVQARRPASARACRRSSTRSPASAIPLAWMSRVATPAVPSRAASGMSLGRPLACENTYTTPRRSLNGSARAASVRSSRSHDMNRPMSYSAIPEGVEVTQGDPAKTKLPIFGKLRLMCKSS